MEQILACIPKGPALPPNECMKFKTSLLGKTRIKIINEKDVPASISLDGVAKLIPAVSENSNGVLLLSKSYYGKIITITNVSNWVLKIEW